MRQDVAMREDGFLVRVNSRAAIDRTVFILDFVLGRSKLQNGSQREADMSQNRDTSGDKLKKPEADEKIDPFAGAVEKFSGPIPAEIVGES